MDNQVLIENIRIDMINVDGFYINRESPILTIIEIMDKNSNIYGLTSLNFGRIGRDFEVFLSDFERIVRDVNPNLKELTFFDFHTKQYIFTKIVLIIGSGYYWPEFYGLSYLLYYMEFYKRTSQKDYLQYSINKLWRAIRT